MSILLESSNTVKELLPTLPETVILCKEDAAALLGAAFDNATIEPSATDNICSVLSRALWLVSGEDENLLRITPPTQ